MMRSFTSLVLFLFSISSFSQEFDVDVLNNIDSDQINELLNEKDILQSSNEDDNEEDLTLKQIQFTPSQKFGFDFIRTSPTSISASTELPIPGDYRISLKDELEVILSGTKQAIFTLPVRLDGSVLFPELGSVSVLGESFAEVKIKLRNLIKNSYVGVNLDLSIGDLSAKKITIIGAVNTPGSYLVNPFTTISNALAYSGGVQEYASLRQIKVMKVDGRTIIFDLYDLLINGDTKNDVAVDAGDIIVLEPTTSFVNLKGSVLRPLTYEYLPNDTFQDLIDFAMGPTEDADGDSLWVSYLEDGFKKTKTVSYSEQISKTGVYEILIGNLITKLNLDLLIEGSGVENKYHDISDYSSFSKLIESLIFSDDIYPFYALYAQNGDGTTRKLTAFSLSDPETYKNLPLENNSTITFFDRASYERNYVIQTDLVQVRLGLMDLSLPIKGKIKPKDIYDFFGSDAILNLDNVVTLTQEDNSLNSFDESFDSNKILGIRFPTKDFDKVTVSIRGDVQNPGRYTLPKNTTLDELYELMGGFQQDAYQDGIFVSREDVKDKQRASVRKAKRILTDALIQDSNNSVATSVDIQQVIALADDIDYTGRISGDFSNNSDLANEFILQEGDYIFVPTFSKTITVHGEVLNASTFLHDSVRSYKDYVELSGGYSEFADKNSAYVIKANGESFQLNRGLFKKNYYPEPGDIIIVPRDLSSLDLLPIVSAATQIISNIAFSQAALNSLD